MLMLQNKENKYRIASYLLAFFSVFPFCIDMSMDGQQSMYGNQILLCVLIFILHKFYFWSLMKQKKCIQKPVFILANLYTAILLFGGSFYRNASWSEIVTTSTIQIIKVCLIYSGTVCVLYFILIMLFEYADTEWVRKFKSVWFCVYSKKSILLTGILILICWSPYIVLKYPGVTAWDTGTVLKDIFDNQTINNGVPAFTVLYFTFFIKIGDILSNHNVGLALFVCIQSAAMAAIFSWGICYLERCRVVFIYRFIVFICICFLPLYPFTAIQMGSDFSYSIAVVIYTLFLVRYVWKKEQIKWYEWIFQTFVLVLMTLFRHTGIYIVIVSLFVFIILNIKEKKWGVVWMHMFTASIYILWNIFILPHVATINVINTSSTLLNITKQQIGNYIVIYNDFTNEEKQKLSRMVTIDKVAERYNPELVDPLFSVIHIKKEDTADYLKLWAKLFFRHPDAYIQAAVNMWYGYYYPDYTCKTKVHIFTDLLNINDSENLQIHYPYFLSDGRKLLDSWSEILLKIPITSTLYRIGVYTWMLIFSIAYIICKRKWKAFALFIPPGLTLLICMLSPVCGYTRYAYPIMFTMPFLFGLWFTYGEKNKDTKDV